MARKPKPPEAGAPLWMCTYGDLMSLLLCFFIMLFALSIISPPTVQALADSLQQDFEGYSAQIKARTPKTKVTMTPITSAARSRRVAALIGGQPTPGPPGEAREVHAMLRDGETVRGGVIRFELGSDELTEQTKRDLRRTVFPILQGSHHKIMVKGYSSPTEEGGEYQRGFDLAFFRASNVVDHFISLGLSKEFFEIAVEPWTVPRLNLLPAGTDQKYAGATAEIILLNQTSRSLRE